MKKIIAVFTLVSVMFLAAAATTAQDTGSLAGTEWQLVSMGGEDIPGEVTVTLELSEGDSAGGSAGCNTYGASYTATGDEISFDSVVSTMMACEDSIMTIEQNYLAALESALRYEQLDQQLTITYADGQQLVFVPLVNLVGSAWQLVSLDGEIMHGVITLMFGEDGNISGSGGCNSYGGSYTANGGALNIEQVINTLIACSDEQINGQELLYFSALQAATRYEINDDQLVLTYGDERHLIFVQHVMLAGTQWQLVSQAGTEVTGDSPLTLNFEADNQVTGFGGCNTYRTTYTLDGSQLTLGDILSTRRACADESGTTQEQAYFEALRTVERVTLEDGQLVLTYENGETLVFNEMMSLADTAWQLQMIGEEPVVEGSSITLEFVGENQAAGSGGCNQYSGSYSADGETISFSQVASTERACLDEGIMTQEQAYYAALASASSYEQTADQLTINYDGGQQLIFTTMDVTSSPQ